MDFFIAVGSHGNSNRYPSFYINFVSGLFQNRDFGPHPSFLPDSIPCIYWSTGKDLASVSVLPSAVPLPLPPIALPSATPNANVFASGTATSPSVAVMHYKGKPVCLISAKIQTKSLQNSRGGVKFQSFRRVTQIYFRYYI